MQAIRVREVSSDEFEQLEQLYHETKIVRVRTRAQMILLAIEQQLVAAQIASIVRKDEQTVRRWLKRFNQEGVEGLSDAPRSGARRQVTDSYQERLLTVVRRRPRSLDQPYSIWSLARLVDFMAEETGLRFSAETVRLILKANGIVISRPQHKVSSPDPEYQLKKRRLKNNGIT